MCLYFEKKIRPNDKSPVLVFEFRNFLRPDKHYHSNTLSKSQNSFSNTYVINYEMISFQYYVKWLKDKTFNEMIITF